MPEGFPAPGASKWEDAHGMTQGEARCHSVRNLSPVEAPNPRTALSLVTWERGP
ncbi:MAG: hypothetical protein ACE5NG_20185 [bacterium]